MSAVGALRICTWLAITDLAKQVSGGLLRLGQPDWRQQMVYIGPRHPRLGDGEGGSGRRFGREIGSWKR